MIGFDRKDDPELHDIYSRKLLIPGWAGEVTDTEARHIAEQLTKSARLRRDWHVRLYFHKRWRHISPDMARRLCQAWARNPSGALRGFPAKLIEKTAGKEIPATRTGRLSYCEPKVVTLLQ